MPWFWIQLSDSETIRRNTIEQNFTGLWAIQPWENAVLFVERATPGKHSMSIYFSPGCSEIEGFKEWLTGVSGTECSVAPLESEVMPISPCLDAALIPFRIS
jgi:hypothetical protein